MKKAPQTGSELRKSIAAEFKIDSSASLALLDVAAEAFDQALAAEAILAKDGLVVQGSRGPRPHPCTNISRDARMRMMTALKALNLEP